MTLHKSTKKCYRQDISILCIKWFCFINKHYRNIFHYRIFKFAPAANQPFPVLCQVHFILTSRTCKNLQKFFRNSHLNPPFQAGASFLNPKINSHINLEYSSRTLALSLSLFHHSSNLNQLSPAGALIIFILSPMPLLNIFNALLL